MTTPQQNKLSMYFAVLNVMTKFNSIWGGLTLIAAMVTRLTQITEQLGEKTGVQGTKQTGVSGGKNRKNLSMAEWAAEIAGDLHSLAVIQGNDQLAGQVDLHISHLIHLGDTVVAPRCQEIHDLAVENATELAGLNAEIVEDTAALQTAINVYKPLVGKSRTATGVKKGATEEIDALEHEADALLADQLDRSLRKQKRKNPQFFGEYTSARMIIDLGTRHEKPASPGDTTTGKTTPPASGPSAAPGQA